MANVWFIVQKYEIFNINDKVIGFWDEKTNYDLISAGDKIIYYRGGRWINDVYVTGNTEGIYSIKTKAKNIDLRIAEIKIKGKNLIYQFELEEIEKIRVAYEDLNDEFTFYDKWRGNDEEGRHGSGIKQVYNATEKDIDKLRSIHKRKLA